jgi:hypothetical protein
MNAWEYCIVDRSGNGSHRADEEKLNTLGRDGWELAYVTPGHFYLKRSLKVTPQ